MREVRERRKLVDGVIEEGAEREVGERGREVVNRLVEGVAKGGG